MPAMPSERAVRSALQGLADLRRTGRLPDDQRTSGAHLGSLLETLGQAAQEGRLSAVEHMLCTALAEQVQARALCEGAEWAFAEVQLILAGKGRP